MSMEPFVIHRTIDYEDLSRQDAADDAPRPALLFTAFLAAALLSAAGAVFFPVSFVILAGAAYALYAAGQFLTIVLFGCVEWAFVAVFGLASAAVLFVLFRLMVRFENRLANHGFYRAALHLWRSLAVFAAAFVALSVACRSAELGVPLIGAGLAAFAFQAILLRDVEVDPEDRMPVMAACLSLVPLLGLAPLSFALNHYATQTVVAASGTAEQKQAAERARDCSIDGAVGRCRDGDLLFRNAQTWLLYHGPVPPLWVMHRDLVGTPINPAAWQTFKTELRAFSERHLPVGTEPERIAFGRGVARIFVKWSMAEDAFAFGPNWRERRSSMQPPAFLSWAGAHFGDAPAPAKGLPGGNLVSQAE